MIPAEYAVSSVCQQGFLDGARLLVDDCGDGSCGKYEVGSNNIDLGFGSTILRDEIWFAFYSTATGTFDLGSGDNSNYATCWQCILVFQDFVGVIPQKTFFQTGGTLTIDAGTVPGTAANVGLSWSNVTLAQVTINASNVSTLVPNGDCYTVISDRIFDSGFQAP